MSKDDHAFVSRVKIFRLLQTTLEAVRPNSASFDLDLGADLGASVAVPAERKISFSIEPDTTSGVGAAAAANGPNGPNGPV